MRTRAQDGKFASETLSNGEENPERIRSASRTKSDNAFDGIPKVWERIGQSAFSFLRPTGRKREPKELDQTCRSLYFQAKALIWITFILETLLKVTFWMISITSIKSVVQNNVVPSIATALFKCSFTTCGGLFQEIGKALYLESKPEETPRIVL